MKEFTRVAGVVAVVMLVTVSAWSAFQASDLVYVPVAAHNAGLEGSLWRTDLSITNVDSAPVDLALFFLPTGAGDNSGFLTTRSYAVGGRADQGYGVVDEALADIPPGGTVALTDVVDGYWTSLLGESSVTLGAIVVMACEAEGFQEDGGCSTYRNVVVQSRTYNATTIWVPDPDNEGSYIQEDATYGQTIPGVPWYNLADGGAVLDSGDFSYQVLVGAGESDNFRFNLGLLNASDLQTTLYLLIQPYQANGEPFTDAQGATLSREVALPPLAQIQYNGILKNAFGIQDATGVSVKVSIDPVRGWSTSNPNPRPMFTCYGSIVDNRTNDSTTVLPSFAYPYDVSCMWSGSGSGGGGGAGTVLVAGSAPEPNHAAAGSGWRPVEMPPR